MDKLFEEVKVKMVMKLNGVSRKTARNLLEAKAKEEQSLENLLYPPEDSQENKSSSRHTYSRHEVVSADEFFGL
jgi:Holliday junction resolvasome RuvABC DNA-binding subunit